MTNARLALAAAGLMTLGAASLAGQRTASAAHRVGRARPAGDVDERGRTERPVRAAPRVRRAAITHRRRVRAAEIAGGAAARQRQRRVRRRDRRHPQCGRGRLGDVAAAALAGTRQGLTAHVAGDRSAGRPGPRVDGGGAQPERQGDRDLRRAMARSTPTPSSTALKT